MSAIVNTNLAGFTVEYNGIQFGGADATYQSFPPQYHFVGELIWDDSHRAVMGVRYTLRIVCVFIATSEAAMSSNMFQIRKKLTEVGKELKLSGLGSGFDWINPALNDRAGDKKDIGGGPIPTAPEMHPIGQLCWELNWSISFEISECAAFAGFASLAFSSFNFATTWRNDFEGYSTRVIQGKVTIPFIRNTASPKTVLHIAEETRGTIFVYVPDGFKRVENTWHEGMDKHSLEFTIVDQQLQGDPYPVGITHADGMFSFNTGSSQGNPMNKAVATLTCSFKTAPNQQKSLAGQIFIAMVLAKQAEIQTAMNAATAAGGGVPVGQILPLALSIQNGKFDSARLTQASMSWFLTQDFNSLLKSAKIFDPIPGVTQTYAAWKASVSDLWSNRGNTVTQPYIGIEHNIIDLCDNVQSKSIGQTTNSPYSPAVGALSSLTCPTVPANGGWIHFDLNIHVLRQEQSSRHIKAATYSPSLGGVTYEFNAQPATGNGDAIKISSNDYSQSTSDQDVTEYHGNPTFLIGLTFSGVRFKHPPFIPEIKSVQSMIVRPYGDQQVPSAKHVMDSFGCPVWAISGYRVYSVPGKVTEIKPVSSLTAADTTIALEL